MKALDVKDGEIVMPEAISFATLHGLLRMGYELHVTVKKDGLSSKPQVFVRDRPQVKSQIRLPPWRATA